MLRYTDEEQQGSQCVSAGSLHEGKWRAPDVLSWMMRLLSPYNSLSARVILTSHYRLCIYSVITSAKVGLYHVVVVQMHEGEGTFGMMKFKMNSVIRTTCQKHLVSGRTQTKLWWLQCPMQLAVQPSSLGLHMWKSFAGIWRICMIEYWS